MHNVKGVHMLKRLYKESDMKAHVKKADKTVMDES